MKRRLGDSGWKKVTRKRHLQRLANTTLEHEWHEEGIKHASIRRIRTREGRVTIIKADYHPTKHEPMRSEKIFHVKKGKKNTHSTRQETQNTTWSQLDLIRDPNHTHTSSLSQNIVNAHADEATRYKSKKITIDDKVNKTTKIKTRETSFIPKDSRHMINGAKKITLEETQAFVHPHAEPVMHVLTRKN